MPYPVKLILTGAGRLVVTDQDGWVQPEAAPSMDGPKPPPIDAVAQAFLQWLYDNNHLQPMPQKFLDDPRSVIEDHQVDEGEMVEAVRLLVAKGLVTGPASWQSQGVPLRIRLTDAGLICVIDQDADTKPQMRQAQLGHGGTTVDTSVTTTGRANTVVAHSGNVNVFAEPARAPEFEVRYRQRVGRGRHELSVRMITGPQQLHVTIDVAVLDPQEGLAAELDGGAGRREWSAIPPVLLRSLLTRQLPMRLCRSRSSQPVRTSASRTTAGPSAKP